MLRAIILGLVLIVAVGTVIPLATDYTEAAAKVRQVRKQKKQKRAKKYRRYRSRSSKPAKRYRKAKRSKNVRRVANKRYTKKVRKSYKKRRYVAKKRTSKKRSTRRYTKPWMKTYKAKQTRKKTIAKRKRNMRLKRIRLANQRVKNPQPKVRNNAYREPQGDFYVPQNAPNTSVKMPSNYTPTVNADGDVVLDVIGPSVGETTLNGRNKTVGGVSTTTLRRQIIDKMIQENGWVENDYSKDVGDKKVYVVVAKSADKNNRVQSRTFYFTESNGQIYRVSSKASEESSEQVVKKSEKVIETLQKPEDRPQQAQKQ